MHLPTITFTFLSTFFLTTIAAPIKVQGQVPVQYIGHYNSYGKYKEPYAEYPATPTPAGTGPPSNEVKETGHGVADVGDG